MVTYKNLNLLFFLFCFTSIAIGQSSEVVDTTTSVEEDTLLTPDFSASTTIFQKISSDSFFHVTLQTNFDSLIKNKKVSLANYPGTILFKNPKGDEFKIRVKIEPRGRSRRRVCSMPPLKIDFPKKELANLGLFPGCDKLKLVTHCNDTENSDQILMKEFWVYNLYNKITTESFKVHPVQITYVNSNNPEEKMERRAFFIESNEELAYRLGGEIKELFGTTPEMLEPTAYYNTLLFNYMVANLDWDILVGRNVKLIQKEENEKLTLVPYDFDFSGLVKAPHARLNPDYGQKDIEERFPQGYFPDKVTLQRTAKAFLALEKTEFKCYLNCTVLDKKVKKQMQRYLKGFFDFLRDESDLEEAFLKD